VSITLIRSIRALIKIIDICGTPDEEIICLMINDYAKKYVSEMPFKN